MLCSYKNINITITIGPVPSKCRSSNQTKNYIKNSNIPFVPDDDLKKKFREKRGLLEIPKQKYLEPEYDQDYRCSCGFQQDPRDTFEQGTLDSEEVYIHCIRPVYDSRHGYMGLFYRKMRSPNEDWRTSRPPCDCKAYYTGNNKQLLRVTGNGKVLKQCHFISYEYLWKFHLMSVETSTSEKGWLRSELIFNNLIYGDTNGSLTWDIWQKGYDLFLDAIEFGNANECKDCPEELPEGDHEENYKDIIEIHLGDGICSGNEINSINRIPEDKLFGTVAPEGSIEKKVVEAKDKTFLLSDTRITLKKLVKNRDTITALKIATSSLKKMLKKKHMLQMFISYLIF